MTKFTITVSREGDERQGIAPLTQIITNGLSCILAARDVKVANGSNCDQILFEADPPESIEMSEENMVTMFDEDELDEDEEDPLGG